MLFHCLCVVFLSVGTASSAYYDNNDKNVKSDDFNGTFLIFDVKAHKGSGGNLKTASQQLKNTEYAVKIIGEDRAIFVVRDDDECDTVQTDFHGLQVDAFAATGSNNDITFNETGLVVVVLETNLGGADLDRAFDDALEKCGDCFKIFAVIGNKPQKCILIGNIPLDQINSIVNSTTTDNCCDSAYTRRAVDFKKHRASCFDFHAVPVHKPVHKPIHVPVHKPIHVPTQKPIPHLVHKPINFPDNVKYEAKRDEHLPVDPHKNPIFPPHEIKPHKIEDPHFSNVKFPSLKGDNDYKPTNFGPKFDFDVKNDQGAYF